MDTPLLEIPAKRDGDLLAKAISERQYRDWREFLDVPFNDREVRRALRSLAEEMRLALERSTTEEEARPFATPFVEPADIPELGGQEDPRDFVRRMRLGGAMEQQAPFIGKSEKNLPEPGKVFRDIDQPWCPKMVVIPVGNFVMGSSSNEEHHQEDEEPKHSVRVGKPGALGIYPVTFYQFDHFCDEAGCGKPDDNGWGREGRPVINVNIKDAEAYLAWLSEVTGNAYGLPSEAIWEYSCRAGTTTPFSTGETITTEQANYDGHHPNGSGEQGGCREQTIDAGRFPDNPFGLYDMHGNVWEWCADHWHDSYDCAPDDGAVWLDGGDPQKRILRGGAWFNHARTLRSARRSSTTQNDRNNGIGFRCARLQN